MTALAALVLLNAMTACVQSPQETAMKRASGSELEARNRAAVEAAFAAWREGNGSPYDLLADEASWTIVGRSDASRTYASREAFMHEVIKPFNARMRGRLNPTIRSIHVEGEDVIIFFDANGIALDGESYSNTYAWFWTMREGRVVRAYAFFGSIAFNQLRRRITPANAVPPAASSKPCPQSRS